jgi:hypothetical protein
MLCKCKTPLLLNHILLGLGKIQLAGSLKHCLGEDWVDGPVVEKEHAALCLIRRLNERGLML